MKITVLTADSVPLLGGIANYMNGLMTSSNHRIEWILRTIVPGDPEQDQDLPYEVHRFSPAFPLREKMYGDCFLPLRKLNTLMWFYRKRRSTLRFMDRIIREDNPDAVLIPRWQQESHWWCRCCRIVGLPYIIIAHGLELISPFSRFYDNARITDLMNASIVFANSRLVKSTVEDMSRSIPPVLILNPGVVPEELEYLSRAEAEGELSRMGLHGKFILSMGRLTYRKGFDLTAKAFAMIEDKWPGISLVIAGSGDYEDEVIRAVENTDCSDRILMPGGVSEKQKRALMQECEYFVMANRPAENDIEGFGIVFLEANYYGKAVIGGNNGGVPDAVVHGKTGLLVDTPDTESLAQAMEMLLDDDELRNSMGSFGRSRTLEEFSWKKLSKVFLDGIESHL
ncbi:MAG: glycosyltransferase [Candidatus Aegiribacteria sp.]|nr:glycosyltransferase [Candidatus Aegiribacteria sp.]